MAAVSKQYSVQYNLTVNATGAATAISSFKSEISTINETVNKVNESITSIKNVINQVSSTPFKLNIAEFESQLATMERAAKATATKISNALAAAFNGKGAKGNPYIKSLNGTSFLQAQIKQTKAEIAKLSDDLAKSTIIKTKQNAVTGAQSTTSTQDPKILAKLNQAKSYLQSLEDQYAKLTGSDQKTKANNFAKAANTTAKAINTVSTAATGIDRNGIAAIKKMAEALKALNRAPREMRFKISASVTGLNKVSQMASAINTISTYTKNAEKAARLAAKNGTAAATKGGKAGTTASVPVGAPVLPPPPTAQAAPKATATAVTKRPYVSPTTASFKNEIPIRLFVDTSGVAASVTAALDAARAALAGKTLKVKATVDKITVPKNQQAIRIPVKAKLFKKDLDLSSLKTNVPTITISAKFNVSQVNKALSEAQSKAKKPASIKVKLNITEAQAQLKILLNQIKAASPQTIRVSVAQRGASGGAGRGAAATVVTGGGSGSNVMVGRTPSSGNRFISGAEANRLRNMNIQKARWYPLTGNTSLGANTPMLVDMAKGMGTMMAIGGAMSAVSNSIHQSFEYENIMETAKAILKNNSDSPSFDDDFKEMAGIVREVGVKTKFTAPEVAGAAKFLAMAGLDIQSINSAIKPVSNVALAGDLDLETTADKLTNIMTAFDMKSSQIGELSDMLVNTFTRSNTSMMQLAEASQYAAPVAAEYGMNVNEMLSLMGVMGNAGIQGSMAGTSLRMIMNNIIKPSKQQMRWWNEIGVERFNANGTPRSVTEILQEVARKVPEDQLIQPIAGMFRVTSQAAAAQIIKHLQDVDDISKSNLQSAGVAQRIGLAKQNTVQGLMAQVKSMFTEGILRGVEANQDKIKDMLSTFRDFFADPKTIEGLGKLVELFMDMMKIMMQMTKVAVGLYKTFGPVLMMMWKLQLWLSMFGGVVKMFLGTFNGIMAVFSRAMSAFGISTGGATAAAAAGSGAAIAGAATSGGIATAGQIAAMNASHAALTTASVAPYSNVTAWGTANNASFFARGAKSAAMRGGQNWVGNALLASTLITGRRRARAGLVTLERPYQRGMHEARWAYEDARARREAFMRNTKTGNLNAKTWAQLQRLRMEEAKAHAALLNDQARNKYVSRYFGGQNPERSHVSRRYADEYARRAGMYERALKTNQARIAELQAAGGNEKAVREMMNRQRVLIRNAEIYSSAAAQAGVTQEAVKARAQRIYGIGGRMGRAFSTGLNLGVNTMMFASFGSWIKNLAGKALPALAKGFGLLLNPLTLATAGLAVFAANAISKANRIKEEREQSQRADMETARQMKALYAKSFPMLDTGSKFEPVLLKDRTAPSISIKNTPNYAKDPRFEKYYNGQPLSYDASKNTYEMFYKPYYKALYGKDAPSYKDRTLKGVGLWGYEIVDMGELGLELSNKYTDQYKANVYNSNFGKMQKASEEGDAEARYYQAISRPYLAATESDTYKRAVSDIRNIAIELQKDREAGKKVDSSKYIARMYDVAKPYANYEQYEHASLADMTSGSLDYSHIFRTYETQKILFNSLNEIIGNFKDTYKESGDAIELFDKFDFVNTTIQDQLAALGKLVGMVPVMVKDTEGTMHRLYLGINENGVVDIQSFHETLNRMGIAFKDTAYNNTMLLIDMIESIRKVPEYAKHITKESYNNLLTYMNGGKSLFFDQKKDFWSNVANNSDFNLGSKILNKTVYGKGTYDVVMKGLEAAGFKDEEIQKNIIYDMEHQTGRYADKSFYTKDMLNRQMNYYYNLGRKTLINEEYSAAHGENTTIGEDVAGDEGGNGNGTGNKFNPFNTPTTSKNNDQQKYGNHYSRQAARPTQINITIGSLANFDKTFIAKNAEEREMVEAMENKMAEAISMLTSQLSSQLSIVAENASA